MEPRLIFRNVAKLQDVFVRDRIYLMARGVHIQCLFNASADDKLTEPRHTYKVPELLWGRGVQHRSNSWNACREHAAAILKQSEQLDCLDFQRVRLPRAINPLEAWNIIMSRPRSFLRVAFYIHDKYSCLFFGVKQIGAFTGRSVRAAFSGNYLDLFLVEHIGDEVLVLTERDKHPDVMTSLSVYDGELSIVSSVVTHNLFGQGSSDTALSIRYREALDYDFCGQFMHFIPINAFMIGKDICFSNE